MNETPGVQYSHESTPGVKYSHESTTGVKYSHDLILGVKYSHKYKYEASNIAMKTLSGVNIAMNIPIRRRIYPITTITRYIINP